MLTDCFPAPIQGERKINKQKPNKKDYRLGYHSYLKSDFQLSSCTLGDSRLLSYQDKLSSQSFRFDTK